MTKAVGVVSKPHMFSFEWHTEGPSTDAHALMKKSYLLQDKTKANN
jgi:hypothetical protein